MKTIPLRPVPPVPATAPRPAAAVDTRWRLARLSSAPHRLGFFAAAVLLSISGLWWALALGARYGGVLLPWAVPALVAHALVMSMSFMPLFIVGFLFTAGPKWLGLPDVPGSSLVRPVLLLSGGWLLALPGFHLWAPLAGAGMAVSALGWGMLMWRLLRLLRASPAPDKLHATGVAVAGSVGLLAMVAGAVAVTLGDVALARAAAQLSLWGFLAPTFTIVSHRMLPFFTASALPFLDAWRPNWLLWVMLAVLGVRGAGAVADLLWWPLPAVWRWAQVAVEAPAAALMLWLAVRWGLVQSLKIRLLAMLHGGFVWLGLALALAAVSHAGLALGGEGLGLAPTHALSMGYLGCTLIAMITRVASGHSGRPLAADNLAWTLYWGVQAATLLRVGAALWPAGESPLVLLAVAAWAVAGTGWAWRYGGWLGRPRADGRPG